MTHPAVTAQLAVATEDLDQARQGLQTSPIFTAPTSVQPLPTRSPATKRANHWSRSAPGGAFRRSSTKAKCARRACGMFESASASSISS